MLKSGEFVYLHHDKANFMLPFIPGNNFSSHKGNVKFEEGMDYGQKVETNTGDVYKLLRPNLIDYMMKVKRRTTIIYPKEAGMILLELGVQYGTKIIETGSGSGSLTILLSRIVGPEGKIFSFERRKEHLEAAQKNVAKYGKPENVVFTLKDPAEEGGFEVDEVDAVFLDVPAPWTLLEHAYKSLKMGAHVGVLSPCYEQVRGVVDKMEELGFARIRCMEILTRNIQVEKNKTRPYNRMIGHTGYLMFAEKSEL